MTKETKQDVFNDLLDAYTDAIAGGGQGNNGHSAEYQLRYRAANNSDVIITKTAAKLEESKSNEQED